MPASPQFRGVTTSTPPNDPLQISKSSRHAPSLSVASNRLKFSESAAAPCRLYGRSGAVPKVCCKKEVFKDVVEGGGREVRKVEEELTCVMKFGGSSVGSAERMREVADLILGFPEENPVIVLSAMGKTTNHLLLVRTFHALVFTNSLLDMYVLGFGESCGLRVYNDVILKDCETQEFK